MQLSKLTHISKCHHQLQIFPNQQASKITIAHTLSSALVLIIPSMRTLYGTECSTRSKPKITSEAYILSAHIDWIKNIWFAGLLNDGYLSFALGVHKYIASTCR